MQLEFIASIEYGPVEHGIERRDLIDTHRRHLKQPRDVVHDADARPSFVLPLAEVQERNHSSLLVLRWIARDDFLSSPKVIWGK